MSIFARNSWRGEMYGIPLVGTPWLLVPALVLSLVAVMLLYSPQFYFWMSRPLVRYGQRIKPWVVTIVPESRLGRFLLWLRVGDGLRVCQAPGRALAVACSKVSTQTWDRIQVSILLTVLVAVAGFLAFMIYTAFMVGAQLPSFWEGVQIFGWVIVFFGMLAAAGVVIRTGVTGGRVLSAYYCPVALQLHQETSVQED